MTDILNQEAPAQDQPAEQQPTSLFTIGEREYDAEAAKKKIENADAHIGNIEAENAAFKQRIAELEAKASQQSTVEDALALLQSQQQHQPSESPSAAPQTLDTEALMAQARNEAIASANAAVAQSQAKALQEANAADSIAYAQTAYGEDWQAKLVEAGKQVNMDAAQINELAKTNPAMFKRVFQAPKAPSTVSPEGQSAYSRPTTSKELDSIVDGLFGNDRPFSGSQKAKAWMEAEARVAELLSKKI